MTATTHADFNQETEALEVAHAFADSIRGKTIIVTGVNKNGIGYATAEAFASQSPTHLIIAGRTPSKIQESVQSLKEKFPKVDYRPLEIDLSSQKSVRNAAAELLSWSDVPTVDILVNSAGIMLIPDLTINEDDIEITFATNHVGHFLFANLIMPKILKAAEANPRRGAVRVVNVSSGSPSMATMRWSDRNFQKKSKDLPESERPVYKLHKVWGTADPENASYIPLESYNQSKVANLLFAIGLNQKLFEKHGVLALALHPGVIPTELTRSAPSETRAAVKSMADEKMFTYRTLGAGASTSLVAALDPKLGLPRSEAGQKENYGAFLADCQISDMALPPNHSGVNAEKLWKLSEELVGESFAW